MQPLIHVTRGGLIECIHYGDIAVCDSSGALISRVGDPSRPIFWRSSSKPIQALAVVQTGAADRFGFTAKELSICCASHHGSADHVATVLGMLAKMGLDETALQCGTHMPSDPEENARLVREGRQPSPAHNNCSGKHTGKLASTLALGANPASYLEPESPVQQLILRNLSALAGVAPGEILIGVDGCSAPTHGMNLRAMATAFARLATPAILPVDLQAAATRIIAAMAAEPVMVSARGAFNSALLEAYQGRIVAKGGAEGLFVLGLTDLGIGVALRTVDGSGRGQSAAVLRVLELLGATDAHTREALNPFGAVAVKNCRNQTVGEIRAAEFSLER